MIDLGSAATEMARLVDNVGDDMLDRPTPCPDYTLGDLLEHVGGLALAFTGAAKKDTGESGAQGPAGDASRLGTDWRTRIRRDLDALAAAWRDPEAWTGMTRAGGVDLPGEIAGLVALDELVIHGWDVARASGQSFAVEPPVLEAVYAFVQPIADGPPEEREGLFGPPVAVSDDAPLLDRVIGCTGRDPSWTASSPVRH
jgi:uncharacterized protein (TIGR03086 family)